MATDTASNESESTNNSPPTWLDPFIRWTVVSVMAWLISGTIIVTAPKSAIIFAPLTSFFVVGYLFKTIADYCDKRIQWSTYN